MDEHVGATVAITADVALPQVLLDAQADGSLVFFVGAGASMDDPSNLPSFDKLARELADLASVDPPIEGQPLDFFLGSMPPDFDAHGQTKKRLTGPESKPNRTHKAIVRLAASRGPVRIVTTNFDDHLAAAATDDDVKVSIPDVWIGPALPLGDKFTGLVHLHGSVRREAEELVLTDKDFGIAYLTSAWATRFLLPMFQKFTVIFIGYGHDDPLMRYLALGLPSNTRRYALVDASEIGVGKWERLDVTSIGYPVVDGDHGALVAALEVWDARARMGRLDHEARVREIVAGGPQLEPVERDYLLGRLRTAEGVLEFARATEGSGSVLQLSWLRWVEDLPQFRALFAGECNSKAAEELSWWFCQTFIASPALNNAAMNTVERLGQRFAETLFQHATWAASQLDKKSQEAWRRWATFLGTSIHGQSAPAITNSLFPRYPDPANTVEPLPVVRAALRPYLVLQRRWSFLQPDHDDQAMPDADVRWAAHEEPLSTQVAKLLEHGGADVHGLETALEDSLNAAYDLHDAFHGERRGDPFSFGRSAIEPHAQDSIRKPVDAIIDGLRDHAAQRLASDPDLPERWWRSGRTLFRRLSLHLLAIDEARSPDEKISWLLDRSLLYEPALKHEVYQVLSVAASAASASLRRRLIDAVHEGPRDREEVEERDRHTAYGVYNLLVWITVHAPDWTEAGEALEAMKTTNPEFGPRPHPDLNMWTSEPIWGPPLPVTTEDFIQGFTNNPEAEFDNLLVQAADAETDAEWRRGSALALLAQVAAMRPGMALEVWDLVPDRTTSVPQAMEIYQAIIEGWSIASLDGVFEAVVERVAARTTEENTVRDVSRFLLAQIRKQIDGHDSPAFAVMREAASRLWKEHGQTFTYPTDQDPMALAPLYLNSWPGDLANYWISEIDRRWRKQRDEWTHLNDEERAALEDLLAGPTDALDATRPALASQLHFMFAADPQFTKSRILPLFVEDETARLAWSAYLYNPRYNDKLLAAGLLDGVVREWDRLDALGEEDLRYQFYRLVASIVSSAYITADQRRGLLRQSVVAKDQEHAAEFAQAVVRFLRMDGVEGSEVWDRWLGEHVRNRLDGIPRVLRPAEKAAWADTVPYLGDAIPAAISMLEGHQVGLTEGFLTPTFREGLLGRHGPALAGHFTDRVRYSEQGDPMLSYRVGELIQILRDDLGEAAVKSLVNAATEKKFIREEQF